jgi:hypothetical protein
MYKVGTLLVEPHLQSILLGYFGDGGCLTNYLPRVVLTQDLLDLSLLSSQGYRNYPLLLGNCFFLNDMWQKSEM